MVLSDHIVHRLQLVQTLDCAANVAVSTYDAPAGCQTAILWG